MGKGHQAGCTLCSVQRLPATRLFFGGVVSPWAGPKPAVVSEVGDNLTIIGRDHHPLGPTVLSFQQFDSIDL